MVIDYIYFFLFLSLATLALSPQHNTARMLAHRCENELLLQEIALLRQETAEEDTPTEHDGTGSEGREREVEQLIAAARAHIAALQAALMVQSSLRRT